MSDPTSLTAQDYENLALVAQGQSSQLNQASAQRLLGAGLVMEMVSGQTGDESLQLTAEGLALIRSSDQ